MTRQDEFKAEMATLLAKYKVMIDVEESGGYSSMPEAITFFAYTEYDKEGNVTGERIDFRVGTRSVDYTDFQ